VLGALSAANATAWIVALVTSSGVCSSAPVTWAFGHTARRPTSSRRRHSDQARRVPLAFVIAGGLCVLAGLAFLTIGRRTFPARARALAASGVLA